MEIKTVSGAKAVINPASFEDAMELKRSVFAVAARQNFKLSDLELDNADERIIALALSVDTDKDVYNAVWPCLSRCTYNGDKITRSTFEDEKARIDYYNVVSQCIAENIKPFIAGLHSLWGMFRSPESLSTPE